MDVRQECRNAVLPSLATMKNRPVFTRGAPRRSGPALAEETGMPSPFRRSLPIAGVAVLVTAALALADSPASATSHLRPETADAAALVAELLTRSAIARGLAGELDRSNVLVYVRHRLFTSALLDGRIGLVQSTAPRRYLILELGCGRTRLEQLVTLGHELRHAVEIARAPAIVDAATLSTHYARIGWRTSGPLGVQTYETEAAIETAADIRKELLAPAARTTHERD
jgi:hypothetical protein